MFSPKFISIFDFIIQFIINVCNLYVLKYVIIYIAIFYFAVIEKLCPMVFK